MIVYVDTSCSKGSNLCDWVNEVDSVNRASGAYWVNRNDDNTRINQVNRADG